MEINQHDLFRQTESLKKQLLQEKQNNADRNKELQTQLHYLDRDLETLFASQTWKIGYGVVNFYRKIMNLLGKKHNGQYMNGDHFKNLIESCDFYTHRKTKLHPTIKQTLAGKFPKNHYEPSQIEMVLKDLWREQKIDKHGN
jgi:hypothetical protein